MKQEGTFIRVLPAFKIGIDDLEILFEQLLALFDKPEEVIERIEIKSYFNNLTFNGIEALKDSHLRGRVYNFKFSLSQGGRRVCISRQLGRLAVSASGDSPAWCGGANETVYSFIQKKKLWYHKILSIKWDFTAYFFISPILCQFSSEWGMNLMEITMFYRIIKAGTVIMLLKFLYTPPSRLAIK